MALVLACVATSGCNFTPSYERPSIPESEGPWPEWAQVSETGHADGAEIGWREFFTEPRMQWLIERALENNRNLRIAALNIEAAQAQYGIRSSFLYPTVDAEAGADYFSTPRTVEPGERIHREIYAVGIGVSSWEVDLWSRIRNLSDEALQSYFAVEQTSISVRISLIAEVVNAYLDWLSDLELIRISEDTLRSQQQTYELQVRSLDSGLGTELDVTQALSSVEQARVRLAQTQRFLHDDFNRLVLLVGEPIADSDRAWLAEGRSLLERPDALRDVPPGLPSDLLIRRPDIRSAERELMAANASIGAARAAFFPTITLTGAVGTTSDGLAGLFTSGSDFWTFAPQIRWPIFDGGLNQSNLDLAEARRRIEIARYERTIQEAFREVADALSGRVTLLGELEAQRRFVAANQSNFDLYTQRFEQGLDSFFNALIWQRLLFASQLELVDVQRRQLANRVTMYRVLGGGWRE